MDFKNLNNNEKKKRKNHPDEEDASELYNKYVKQQFGSSTNREVEHIEEDEQDGHIYNDFEGEDLDFAPDGKKAPLIDEDFYNGKFCSKSLTF